VRRFLAEPSSAVATRGKSLSLDELTPRERTVLEAIAKGLDNAEIARLLRLSEKTVRNHITRIFDKTRVKHRYQAIVMAREAGLGSAASPPVGAEAGHLSRTPGAAPAQRRDIGLNTTAFAGPTTSTRGAPSMPARKSR
jgi:DNA-binding CsgD family transcriptional regulator